MKMDGVMNYLKLKILMPVYVGLSLFLTSHSSSSSYHDKINSNHSIEHLEKDAQEMKSIIEYLEDRVIEIRKSRIKSAIPRSSRYLDFLFVCSKENNIEPEEVAAVISCESDWDIYAVSSMGAAGPTMLMPQTANNFGLSPIYKLKEFVENEEKYARGEIKKFQRDNFRKYYSDELRSIKDKSIDARFDPEKSIPAGIRYMGEMRKIFNDRVLILAAYNAGPGIVDEWLINGWKGEIDKIQYPETKKFVDNIIMFLEKIKEVDWKSY